MPQGDIPVMGRRGGPGVRFAEIKKAEDVKGTLLRISRYLLRERMIVILMLITVIVSTLLGIAAPSLQSRAIDIIAGEQAGKIAETLVIMFITYLLYGGGHLAQGLISAHLSQRIVRKLRSELFNKTVDLPVKYLDIHSHGDIMSRMTNDIENISNTVSQSLSSLLSGVLTVIGTVSVMIWYCWQLALLSCATVIFTAVTTKLLSKHVRKYSRKRQSLLGVLNGTVEEMVTGYRTVTAYNRQEAIVCEFNDTSDLLTKAGIFADSLGGIMGPIMNCISNIGFVVIAGFGGLFAINGLISIGVISAFIVYARQFNRPINEIAQVYGQLQTAVAGAERVFAVLDEASEDKSGFDTLPEAAGNVEFRNVTFSYSEGNPVLHNFSLNVPSGKKVALVGATGSGKTTVVNLLMRFYKPDSGDILIDGKSIFDVTTDELRKKTAIVLQDTVLFSDTIRNNLMYGNESATDKQAEKAAVMSNCDGFISALPEGYNTMLGESGGNISQGQRQLLAIARAFIADPSILILDEATSSVDTRTEKHIQDAMVMIMRERTSIIIAHRLSTIRDADLIVVMDKGRIVESGNHDALLSSQGKYYELYMTQYAGIAT